MHIYNKIHVLFIDTLLHVSALIAPSAGKILSYAQNYCYIDYRFQIILYMGLQLYLLLLKTIFGSTQDLKW